MKGRTAHSAVCRWVSACRVCSDALRRIGAAAHDEFAQRPDHPAGQALRPAAQRGQVVAFARRCQRRFDDGGGLVEVGRQGGFQCGAQVHGAGLEFQVLQALQRQRLEARGIEAGPGALQVARGLAHRVGVDQVLEGLGHAYSATGSVRQPRKRMRGSRCGVPRRRRPGQRASSRPKAMRASSRATFMPAQACAPWPKARCGLGLRPTSSRSGSMELRRVAVGAADGQRDEAARRQLHAADAQRRGAEAVVQLQRALVAQQFLHRQAQQRRVVQQPLPLVALRQQGVDAVADQVGGGLVASVEQEDAVVQQFDLAQPFAAHLAVDQPCQHVEAARRRAGAGARPPGCAGRP